MTPCLQVRVVAHRVASPSWVAPGSLAGQAINDAELQNVQPGQYKPNAPISPIIAPGNYNSGFFPTHVVRRGTDERNHDSQTFPV